MLKHQQTTLTCLILSEILLNSRMCSQSCKTKKIKIVQKIISGSENLKPKLNMTTKESSCKHVIIPMNINNANQLIKDMSTHVININRTLKGIKLNVMADFIHVSRSLMVDFIFIFSFHSILFYFYFYFIFYFQNNSGQGLSVTLSHQSQVDGVVTKLITRLGRIEQKVLEQSDVIQYRQHMLAS